MKYAAVWLVTLFLAVFFVGCADTGRDAQQPAASAKRGGAGEAQVEPEQPAAQSDVPADVQPDAPAADGGQTDAPESLAALEKLGAKLKTDQDGYVTEVSLREPAIDDAALSALSGLPRVKSLLLNDSGITDAGLQTIGQIKTLRNLDLRSCRISNAGLEALIGLTELQALRLNGKSGATTVDDHSLAAVAQMKSLKVLLLAQLCSVYQ